MKTIVSSCGRATAIVDDDINPRLLTLSWCLSGPQKKYFRSHLGSLHRLVVDAQPGQAVDHINGDTTDNRRANLRFCTQSQNLANRKIQAGRVRGVRLQSGGHWHARVTVNGKEIQLGSYLTKEEAAHVRDLAAIKYFGEFAHLNALPLPPGVAAPRKARSDVGACEICGSRFPQRQRGSLRRFCGAKCIEKAHYARRGPRSQREARRNP